ncbi:MAG: aminotransferase class I/II-fold pyridoxal phosphate-dependent enzyme, partial [Ilumatobacteraceae bacterium]
MTAGFVPPPYPYDRLRRLDPVTAAHPGGTVDLSIGTPFDPPPPGVLEALSGSGTERAYPPSIGSPALRDAASRWIARRFGLEVASAQIGATIGTKEFVGTLPQWMALRDPSRDTVLYPAISYPTYEMGATLAGCRAVAIPARPGGGLDLDSVSDEDAERALLLWV